MLFWTALFSFSPANAETGEKNIFWNVFPAHPLLHYLPTCLTTYTTHTLINGETGDPCPPPWRKAEDPCPGHHALCLYRVWWTYPRLPINTRQWQRGKRGGGEKGKKGNQGTKFWRRREEQKTDGGSLFERRGARAKQKKKEEKGERRVKEQNRRGRRRATVAPPSAPPSFLPATIDRTAIAKKNHHHSANNSSHH